SAGPSCGREMPSPCQAQAAQAWPGPIGRCSRSAWCSVATRMKKFKRSSAAMSWASPVRPWPAHETGRVLDVPEALGLLAPRTLTMVQAQDPAFARTARVYQAAGVEAKLQLLER